MTYKLFFILIFLFVTNLSCNKDNCISGDFKIDFCTTCITERDIYEYESKIGSKQIPQLSDAEHFRIFRMADSPRLAYKNSYERTDNNIYFLRFDSTLNCSVVSCYNLTHVNDDIIYYSVKKKYYYEDKSLDTLITNQKRMNYDFNQFQCNYTLLNNKLGELIGSKGSKRKPESLLDIYPDLYMHVISNDWFYNEGVILLEFNVNLTNDIVYVREYKNLNTKDFAIYFSYSRGMNF
jgi:hypothetical protein